MKKRLLAVLLTLVLAVGISGLASAKTAFSDGNRISRVELREKTVEVSYRAEEAAELAAALYTEDGKELFASGRTKVSASADGTAEIPISGEIPEYAVVKVFLLTRREHAPLCPAYTTSGYFRQPEDIGGTEAGAFDPERTLKLGDGGSFAVLKHGVVLVRTADDVSGKNRLVSRDDDAKCYQIQDAGTELKTLYRGQLLALETEPGQFLFVRVRKTETEGDTVTLHGDEGLKLGDLFDLMKIKAEAEKETRTVSLEQDGLNGEAVVGFSGKFEVCGTDEQEFRMDCTLDISGTATTTGAGETDIELDAMEWSPVEGVWFRVAPVLHLTTEDVGTVEWKLRQKLGFIYNSETNQFEQLEPEAESFLAADRAEAVSLQITAEPTVTLWEDAVRLRMKSVWKGNSRMNEPDGTGTFSGTFAAERRLEAGAVFLAEYGDPHSREFLPEELPEKAFAWTPEKGRLSGGKE